MTILFWILIALGVIGVGIALFIFYQFVDCYYDTDYIMPGIVALLISALFFGGSFFVHKKILSSPEYQQKKEIQRIEKEAKRAEKERLKGEKLAKKVAAEYNVKLRIKEDANMRSNPDTSSSIKMVCKAGEFVEGELWNSDWYKIYKDGEVGYIHKSLVNTTKITGLPANILEKIGFVIESHPLITFAIILLVIFCSMKFTAINCIFGIIINLFAIICYIGILATLRKIEYNDISHLIAIITYFSLLMCWGADGVSDTREDVLVWGNPIRYWTPHFQEIYQESHWVQEGHGPIINFFISLFTSGLVTFIVCKVLDLLFTWPIAVVITMVIGILISILELVHFIISLVNR